MVFMNFVIIGIFGYGNMVIVMFVIWIGDLDIVDR